MPAINTSPPAVTIGPPRLIDPAGTGGCSAEILHRSEWNLPANLSVAHINRGEQAPGRRCTRQVRRRLQKAPKQTVGRSGLRSIVAVFGAHFVFPEVSPRNEFHFSDQIVRIRDEETVLRIEGVTAPHHSSEVSRHGQRAPKTRRSEDAFVAQPANPVPARLAILRRRPPRIVGRNFLRSEWRRSYGEGLCRRSDFAGNVALRNAVLLNRKDRLSGIAIQYVKKPGLIPLNNDVNFFSLMLQCCEQWRRCRVVVPQVVMHELKTPGDLAGLTVQCNYRIGPLVVSRSKPAIVVGTGAPSRHEDEIALHIHRHDRPRVSGADVPVFVLLAFA